MANAIQAWQQSCQETVAQNASKPAVLKCEHAPNGQLARLLARQIFRTPCPRELLLGHRQDALGLGRARPAGRRLERDGDPWKAGYAARGCLLPACRSHGWECPAQCRLPVRHA